MNTNGVDEHRPNSRIIANAVVDIKPHLLMISSPTLRTEDLRPCCAQAKRTNSKTGMSHPTVLSLHKKHGARYHANSHTPRPVKEYFTSSDPGTPRQQHTEVRSRSTRKQTYILRTYHSSRVFHYGKLRVSHVVFHQVKHVLPRTKRPTARFPLLTCLKNDILIMHVAILA